MSDIACVHALSCLLDIYFHSTLQCCARIADDPCSSKIKDLLILEVKIIGYERRLISNPAPTAL